MIRQGSVGAGILGVLLATAVLAAGGNEAQRPDARLVDQLDKAFQDRFRSLTAPQAPASGAPRTPAHEAFARTALENAAERSAAAELRSHGWQTLLFAAGRRAVALGRSLDSARKASANPLSRRDDARLLGLERAADQAISRPVAITGGRVPLSAPHAKTLLPAVLDASRVIRSKGTFAFRSGSWYVVARPVRAEKQECLSCHAQAIDGKRAEVGDPVGVVLFAFTPAAH